VITPDFFQIIATDISPTALETAAAAVTTRCRCRAGCARIPAILFPPEGTSDDHSADQKDGDLPEIQLLGPFTGLGTFDIIFCRNVAIYFSDTYKRELFRKLARSLNVGGHLMLGSAESLAHYSTDFLLRDYKNSLFYQVK
jgi:chemotaxis protein methyltransferase CheR